ncbi:glycosyltransferase [Intrasporangium calvum]|uniref:Glycosyl transferase group 1 n=1 Tax=Intrasporangium calvum (strain ATCC 23552 / DSM 43043 / JCM 3097 / NBRC 12989 / NCIMB 10167 / NRRL B-3866 / 7 KIP) TaxID=710696 RepID=E6SDU5_INTC7|nr:glycosyltransferase [Intrasporangium calvum]ADU49776.1 glycosyl transferase group 1 [Intrasporangium calvum DSM 43043]
MTDPTPPPVREPSSGPRARAANRPVLVVTVVHHPDDARIRYREIEALLDAGHPVTYAAPFADYGVDPAPRAGLTTIDLPRAVGRRRLKALRESRRLLARLAPAHGAVIIHDPELLLAATGRRLPHLIWDVHEDTAAAIEIKGWLPPRLRRPAAAAVRWLERAAERRHALLLAEPGYTDRFSRTHPVIPNTTTVPETVAPPGSERVVYLGAVTVARGARTMAEAGRLVRQHTDGAVSVEIIGPPRDEESRRILEEAADRGDLRLHGFVANQAALEMVSGSLAGLSLLRDEPNYRHSTPTKVYEYLAHGVPVVTTPLPLARDLVAASGAGIVVPFDDAEAVAAAVVELWRDPERAARMGADGHAYARLHHDWRSMQDAFVEAVRAVMGNDPQAQPGSPGVGTTDGSTQPGGYS